MSVERHRVSGEALRELGWEVVCLLEEIERDPKHEHGFVYMKAVKGLPAFKLEIRRLPPPDFLS